MKLELKTGPVASALAESRVAHFLGVLEIVEIADKNKNKIKTREGFAIASCGCRETLEDS